MTNKDRLNTMCPTVEDVRLGTKVDQLITLINEMRTDINVINDVVDGVLAKLDDDAGVTDVNYESLWGTASVETVHMPVDLTAPAVDALD